MQELHELYLYCCYWPDYFFKTVIISTLTVTPRLQSTIWKRWPQKCLLLLIYSGSVIMIEMNWCKSQFSILLSLVTICKHVSFRHMHSPHWCLLAKPCLNLLNMHNKHAGRKLWRREEAKGQICDPNVQKGESYRYKLKTWVWWHVL